MNKKLIKEIVKERNPEALFLQDYFDEAIMGTGIHCGKKHVAVYDPDKCIEILMETLNIGEIDALEEFQITLEGSISENKPIFFSDFRKAKEPEKIEVSFEKTLDNII